MPAATITLLQFTSSPSFSSRVNPPEFRLIRIINRRSRFAATWLWNHSPYCTKRSRGIGLDMAACETAQNAFKSKAPLGSERLEDAQGDIRNMPSGMWAFQ